MTNPKNPNLIKFPVFIVIAFKIFYRAIDKLIQSSIKNPYQNGWVAKII